MNENQSTNDVESITEEESENESFSFFNKILTLKN
jgi:hypothetical protein